MNPVTITNNGTATSRIINLDYFNDPFAIGMGVVVTGTITYSVQHTFNNIYDSSVSTSTFTWFNNSSLANLTGNMDGNYAFPVYGIRLVTTGTGAATLTVMPASTVP